MGAPGWEGMAKGTLAVMRPCEGLVGAPQASPSLAIPQVLSHPHVPSLLLPWSRIPDKLAVLCVRK